ncbi:MAG: periplasmic heavy metal sensor [Sinobacteraceae bacterium]|nr:periplasmic heavy metal sensor [Nevskiaceae bacterium]
MRLRHLSIMTLAALGGSVLLAQPMPPPPPPADAPNAPSMGQQSKGQEVREIRRYRIIRDGRERMGPMGAMRGAGIMELSGADPRMLQRLADDLQLTPQQRGKITEHVATHGPEMRRIATDMAGQSRALRELNPADPKFTAAVNEASKRMGDLSAQLVRQGGELRAKVWQVLTPEQRAKADARQQQMKQRRMEMRERRGPGGEGERDMR